MSICGFVWGRERSGAWKEDLGARETECNRKQRGGESKCGIRGWLCFGLLLITIIILCPAFHSAVQAHLSRLRISRRDCLVFKDPLCKPLFRQMLFQYQSQPSAPHLNLWKEFWFHQQNAPPCAEPTIQYSGDVWRAYNAPRQSTRTS